MAPEVLSGYKYNYKADIWSLGTICFEILTGFTPFTGTSKEDLKNNVNDGSYKIPKKLNLSEHCLDFLNSLL